MKIGIPTYDSSLPENIQLIQQVKVKRQAATLFRYLKVLYIRGLHCTTTLLFNSINRKKSQHLRLSKYSSITKQQ